MKNNVELTTQDLERLSGLLTSLEKAKRDKNEKSAIEARIMDFFRQTGIKTYRYKDVVIRFTDERKTVQFDADMLRMKYPEIWKECHSEQTRPPHLQIKKTSTVEDPEETGAPTVEEIAEELANDTGC